MNGRKETGTSESAASIKLEWYTGENPTGSNWLRSPSLLERTINVYA